MVSNSDIRKDMEVVASDGERIGRVDEIEASRIKITREGSPDGEHHYVDIADVARVDEHVHLTKTHAALHAGGASAATAGAGAAAAAGTGAGAAKASPIPPIKNPAVDGAAPRRNYMLPWVLAGLALLALILAVTQCDKDNDRPRGDGDAAELANPRVAGAPLAEGTMAYDVDRFLAGNDGTPRTFTFEKINFNSGTAALREEDRSDLDDLARVLAAYPDSRAAIVGYTDAQGAAAANKELGADRARAVIAALASRGVPADRLEARTGGEADPTATNATGGGRFENRRTELVILKR